MKGAARSVRTTRARATPRREFERMRGIAADRTYILFGVPSLARWSTHTKGSHHTYQPNPPKEGAPRMMQITHN